MKSFLCVILAISSAGSAFALLEDLKKSESAELTLPKVSSETFTPNPQTTESIPRYALQPGEREALRSGGGAIYDNPNALIVLEPWDFTLSWEDFEKTYGKPVKDISTGVLTSEERKTARVTVTDRMHDDQKLRFPEEEAFFRHEITKSEVRENFRGKTLETDYSGRYALVRAGKEGAPGTIMCSLFVNHEGIRFSQETHLDRNNRLYGSICLVEAVKEDTYSKSLLFERLPEPPIAITMLFPEGISEKAQSLAHHPELGKQSAFICGESTIRLLKADGLHILFANDKEGFRPACVFALPRSAELVLTQIDKKNVWAEKSKRMAVSFKKDEKSEPTLLFLLMEPPNTPLYISLLVNE